MTSYPIYFDYNATTPCDPRVVDAMLPFFSRDFGNAASRSHAYGWIAEEAVDIARENTAALIGAEAGEIVFTSGATEAVNLAIRGVYETYSVKGKHIITCSVEHKAVLDTCHYLESIGGEVTVLPVSGDGRVDIGELEAAIRPDTVLISIMYANNETGTIMPVRAIGTIAKKHNVLFFSDATQAVGKIPVNVLEDGIDIMSFSAHKMYGPKGVGALYVRRKNPRVKLTPLQYGGGHEKGMRSGTLNVPGIVGLGKAAQIAVLEMEDEQLRLRGLRDELLNGLLSIEGTALNGDTKFLLPHTCNVSFRAIESQVMISQLNKYLAVSSGSACTSASLEPSYVLRALGIGDELASSSIRFSLGRFSTHEEVSRALGYVDEVAGKLRVSSKR
jgi:cysteine desulfurase